MKYATFFAFAVLFVSLFETGYAQCPDRKYDTYLAKVNNNENIESCKYCIVLAKLYCDAKEETYDDETKQQLIEILNDTRQKLKATGTPICCPEYIDKDPEWKISNNSSTNQNTRLLEESNPQNSNQSFTTTDLEENQETNNEANVIAGSNSKSSTNSSGGSFSGVLWDQDRIKVTYKYEQADVNDPVAKSVFFLSTTDKVINQLFCTEGGAKDKLLTLWKVTLTFENDSNKIMIPTTFPFAYVTLESPNGTMGDDYKCMNFVDVNSGKKIGFSPPISNLNCQMLSCSTLTSIDAACPNSKQDWVVYGWFYDIPKVNEIFTYGPKGRHYYFVEYDKRCNEKNENTSSNQTKSLSSNTPNNQSKNSNSTTSNTNNNDILSFLTGVWYFYAYTDYDEIDKTKISSQDLATYENLRNYSIQFIEFKYNFNVIKKYEQLYWVEEGEKNSFGEVIPQWNYVSGKLRVLENNTAEVNLKYDDYLIGWWKKMYDRIKSGKTAAEDFVVEKYEKAIKYNNKHVFSIENGELYLTIYNEPDWIENYVHYVFKEIFKVKLHKSKNNVKHDDVPQQNNNINLINNNTQNSPQPQQPEKIPFDLGDMNNSLKK